MNAGEIEDWLVARIAETLRLDPSAIDVREPFDGYGLSSTDAVALSGDLEELLGRELSPTLVYEHPSIAALSTFLGSAPGTSAGPQPREILPGDAGGHVAIVGVACRFPGAADASAYWRLLRDGRDAIREVPPERWDASAWFDADPTVPGKAVSRWGGFLEQVDRFDPFFFGISPGEAERMDPQQRLLMELAYESFEDAGYPMRRLAGSRTGVFVGISINEYGFLQHGRPDLINGHSGTGNALCIAANRISYFFDLHGPSLAVDTACSSSLTAVHLACRSLRSGECELAVAGGVNVVLSPAHAIAFTKAGVLALDGRCKVFDARADGYVRGEGGGLVVLKPLAKALADGDAIHAVIRGSAIFQDGRTNGLMAPSRDAQEAVLRAACADAGISPSRVQYVEAHGTGTLLGDSIEARALGAVFGGGRTSGRCAIGSVKSNFGHLEAAAGVAGLVKVALSLEHRALPPSLHFAAPNPHVPFEELGLRVQAALAPWPGHDGPAIAGVSSFGFGGTNVHVILEEAPAATRAVCASAPDRAHLLPVSAHGPDALREVARGYAGLLAAVGTGAAAVHDVCAAASLRRNHLDHRAAFVGRSREDLAAGIGTFLDGGSAPDVLCGRRSGGGTGKLAFVFSGQGSQWHGMARELLADEAVFRAALERCDLALRRHVDWSLLDQLTRDEDRSRLGEIDVVQPVLFALQVALTELWRSWGVTPDAVVGHSMGEAAAAHVAGALRLEDAAYVICARSRLLKRLSGRGGMAVVGLSSEEAASHLAGYEGRLSVAAVNSPRSIVVAGETAALADLVAALERSGVFAAAVNVDVASHSPQTAPLGDELRRCLDGLRPRPASLPFVSTVTGTACDGLLLDAGYWARNVTEPVNFAAAIQHLLADGLDAFVEISPHPILQTSVQQTLLHAEAQGVSLPTLRRAEPERGSMLRSLGALYASGRAIEWSRLCAAPARPVALPSYPWQRSRFWIDEAPAAARSVGGAARRDAGAHPLLGSRIALARSPEQLVWETGLDPSSATFLRDHRVNGEVVLPASAYVEMALAASAAAGIAGTHELCDVDFRRALVLPEDGPRTVQTSLSPAPDGRRSFDVHSRAAGAAQGEWTLHATASFVPVRAGAETSPDDGSSLDAIRLRCREEIRPGDLYRSLAARGLDYGPAMRRVETVRRGDGEALGRIKAPDPGERGADGYLFHPAVLDAAMQVLAASQPDDSAPGAAGVTYVPVGCRKVTVLGSSDEVSWSHAVVRSGTAAGSAEVESDVRLLDESGRCVAELTGLRLARVAARRAATAAPPQDTWIYGVRWQHADWPASQAADELAADGANRWIILADRFGVGRALAAHLEARGQSCGLITYGDLGALREDAGRPPGFSIRRLVDERLATERSRLRGVIDLWSADASPASPVTLRGLRDEQTLGCDAALALVQTLVARSGPLGSPRLWLVTRGVQPVVPKEPVSVAQSPLWGLGKTIAFELPALRCTMVDLDPALEAPVAAKLLFRQLCAGGDEDQVAFRGGRRFVSRLLPYALSCAADACAPGEGQSLHADGTYLITGGLGGLGLAVAGWMAGRGAGRLVLVGRHAPSAAAEAALQKLRGAGAAVAVFSADVADEAQLAEVLARVRDDMPPLRGIVHAAGVLENAAILDLDADRLTSVMAPKVQGAWNLHAATARDELDFFVLFSSAVSVLGSPGQGNYAAGNAFLDALAHHRHGLELPALSIDWGPWADIGLVASGDFLERPAGGKGVKGIRPDRGLEMLGRAIRDAGVQMAVLPFDLQSLLELYPAAAKIPFFAEVGGRQTHVSRLYARPNLRQDYVAPRNEIERKLAELWRQTLRIDRVGVRDSFFELGGDSVLAAQIVTAAHRTFGVGLDLREAFQAFTIEHLATRIESALVARIDELSESEVRQFLEE